MLDRISQKAYIRIMTTITHDKALELIRSIVKEEGTQFAAAKRLDVSPMYLSDILNGKRAISDNVARRLPPNGYRRVIFFQGILKSEVK